MLKPRASIEGPAQEAQVTIEIDGKAVLVATGISVAAAVLSTVTGPTRTTPVNESPRAPYCLMGVCFDCLMEIDGKSNQRACQTLVTEGMQIRRQHGKRTV